MERPVCCVCEKPIEGPPLEMGHRLYCADCLARVTRNRRSLWWASLLGIGILAVLVAVAAFAFTMAQPQLEGTPLIVVAVVLALVPALLWLAFFYLQDVREPEPKLLVLAVFVLGALLAQAVGLPLVREVFRTREWILATPLYHLLGAILVGGFLQQFLIYATVRYSVYYAHEFDERVDGIVYGSAAALGYATMLNIDYVIQNVQRGGVDLASAIIRVAVTAMAMASFGGLLGYFLGRCKFEDEPVWWMPLGLVLAAVLDGLFTFFRGEVTTTAVGLEGGGFNPWWGLLLGAAVAGATFGVLFFLIRRLEQRAPQAGGA